MFVLSLWSKLLLFEDLGEGEWSKLVTISFVELGVELDPMKTDVM
jgi:hypothetical protein